MRAGARHAEGARIPVAAYAGSAGSAAGMRTVTGRPLKAVDPGASAAAKLGAELRDRQVERALTLTQFGDEIGFSAQYISGAELARTTVSAGSSRLAIVRWMQTERCRAAARRDSGEGDAPRRGGRGLAAGLGSTRRPGRHADHEGVVVLRRDGVDGCQAVDPATPGEPATSHGTRGAWAGAGWPRVDTSSAWGRALVRSSCGPPRRRSAADRLRARHCVGPSAAPGCRATSTGRAQCCAIDLRASYRSG